MYVYIELKQISKNRDYLLWQQVSIKNSLCPSLLLR